ncbi:glycosyltransferase family 2 protein [Metabacillus sp. FJAT-52054]|uniref:Glycosyltransferase family 2 protein n=1 Tax=Metabacillus sediminis TaxID=3117746 RepID=A0ABZ2NMJ3_9BACI
MLIVIYTILLFIFLLLTVANSFFMPKLKDSEITHYPAVSILVPLRNEERNVPDLISMLKKLKYPNLCFLLLDDQSEDRTYELLNRHTGDDGRFKILSGRSLPKGWAGKVHACHTLSRHADTELILFLDADVRLAPMTIERAVHTLESAKVSLLTGFPKFPVQYLIEKWLVPMQHFLVYFHLPLLLANRTAFPAATAAHGAFMLFKRTDYEKIGGHESIKDSIVDDVHLTRKMKENRKRVLLANVTDMVTCYMYSSSREAWEGFKKNIFPGFGRSLPITISLCLFYALFYVFPLFLLVYGVAQLIILQSFLIFWYLPYILIVLQKMFIDWRSNQKLSLAFSMPLSAAAFISLMVVSMYTSIRKKGYEWKGRSYS